MDDWMLLGLTAGLLTTVSFVPQLLKGWRTKSMEDLSLIMPTLLSAGMGLWLCYGIVIESLPIIFWNAIALVLNLGLILMKINYSKKPGYIRSEPR